MACARSTSSSTTRTRIKSTLPIITGTCEPGPTLHSEALRSRSSPRAPLPRHPGLHHRKATEGMTASTGPKTDEAAQLEQAMFEIKKVIVGQDRVIERLLVCLLARGHCLLEGVPGLAKTLAGETLATVSGGTFTRLQFTPDLLPADIVGTRIYRASNESFDIEWGPIFANFVLADEV